MMKIVKLWARRWRWWLMIVDVSQHTNEKDIKSIESIIPDQEIDVKKCLFIYSKHKCIASIITSTHTHQQCDLRLEMEAPDEKSTKIRSLATSMLCTLLLMSTPLSNELVFSHYIAAAALGETDEDMMKMKMSMNSQRCCASHWLSQLIKKTLSLTHIWTFPIEKGHKWFISIIWRLLISQ